VASISTLEPAEVTLTLSTLKHERYSPYSTSNSFRQLVKSSRLCTAAIKHIRFSYQGRDICVNCADRVVRTIPIPRDPSFCTRRRRHSYDDSDDDDDDEDDIEVQHKFQDLVNRLQWNACAFSGTGDYVMGLSYFRKF